MFGWRGRLLRVNLASGAINKELLEPSTLRSYLGGRGLGTYLHEEEVPASAAPLGAENHLIFVTGPLTGTLAPNGGRYAVVTKMLHTGEISAASISGNWGPELKFAGFDAIIIEGEATEPVYLWVKDGSAELRAAAHISGKLVGETTGILLAETDEKAIVSCIGPAGENGVDCSVIVSDRISSAGGWGAGAVMGVKNLKAVAVRGTEGFRVADQARFSKAAMALRAGMTPIAAKGSVLHGSVLLAESLIWDSTSTEFKPARTRGCFGCATSFSSFAFDGGKSLLPLSVASLPSDLNERLEEYRLFVDLGLDFIAAKALLASLGKEAEGRHAELAHKLAYGDQLGQGRHGDKAGSANSQNGGLPMDRGPCFVAGYSIVPRLPAANGSDGTASTMMAVLDSVGLCPFLAAGIDAGTIAELLSAATGIAFSQDEVMQAGQDISWSAPQTA